MTMVPLGNDAGRRAMQSDEVDAAVFVDSAQNQAVWAALHDPHLRLMSYGHADAYPRLLPYIKKLTLPSGVINVTHASRLMPTGTSVSGQAFCIDTYRSGSRPWLSGPSSYCFRF